MNIQFDDVRLTRLLAGLQTLGGIGIRLLDGDGRALCAGGAPASLCARIQSSREGAIRCRDCVADVARSWDGGGEIRLCRCHAGACRAILPVRSGEVRQPLAFLCAGPFLDATPPRERPWEAARAALEWFPGGAEALRADFFRLRACGPAERDALTVSLEALAGCALSWDLIRPAGETDARKLRRFLDEHYMEKLTLASVSAQLHIGRTRLCALAKELSGGQTLFQMIARKRIDVAKSMLARTDLPVSAVAEAVGISDYNYFSKTFRTAVGVSPSEFRKRARRDLDDLV